MVDAIVESRSAKAPEQTADQLVGVGDLAIVRRIHRITRWRCIGLVRLIEMEKQEESHLPPGVEPLFGRRQGQRAIALNLPDRQLR